ncbi:hypothetical protein [Moraxella lacunata]|uniref:hypothetical protein n=1 Tax=Moraxella lacunata TaxID=477 RepID=UPI003EE2465F
MWYRKPFVVSLSNHEKVFFHPQAWLRANGKPFITKLHYTKKFKSADQNLSAD